jgi:hypothetical protein
LFLTKAKLKERIFALFRFQKFFVSLLFRYVFASFHFRFGLDAKTSEKTLFSHRSEKKFRFNSLRSEIDGSLSLPFRFISLRSKNNGSFSLPFRFISLRSENDGSFSLFFVLFSLRSIFVLLQISTFRIDVKQAKKALFSHRSEKNFASVSLHFASKQK